MHVDQRDCIMSVCQLTCLKKVLAASEMGDRLATIDMGRKFGAPFGWEELGPHLTQCGLG